MNAWTPTPCLSLEDNMTQTEKMRIHRKTKKGVTATIYDSQKTHSKTRGHHKPTYSHMDLREWLFSQEDFHILYDNWVRLDYQRKYKPSVDRIDDSLGYTMANIQLMTWGENSKKADDDAFSGTLKRKHREVDQFDLDGNFLSSYKSMRIAFRATGVHDCCIRDACSGRQKTAGGYLWRYK